MDKAILFLQRYRGLCVFEGLPHMLKDIAIVAAVFLLALWGLPALGLPHAGSLTILAALMAASWRLAAAGSGWRELGLRRPASLPRAAAATVGWMLTGYVTAAIASVASTQLLGFPPIDASRYGALQGNLPQLLTILAIAWSTAAFGEELLFRGFLLTRLHAVLPAGRAAGAIAVVVQGLCFGLIHAFQGPTGVLVAAAIGIVFGVAYLRSRNLWPIILAHGLIDTVSLTALYHGVVPGA